MWARGACRWPHNSTIDADQEPARFRTVFVADDSEEREVRERTEASLRRAEGWRVISLGARPVADDERKLAASLTAPARRSS